MSFPLQRFRLFVTVKGMMDEQAFRNAADRGIDALFKSLSRASDNYDFEADMNNGALTVEFENPPAKFVVSPNAPVRQIWVSAHSKSFKLDWDAGKNTFVLSETGQTLQDMMAAHISKQLGEEVVL